MHHRVNIYFMNPFLVQLALTGAGENVVRTLQTLTTGPIILLHVANEIMDFMKELPWTRHDYDGGSLWILQDYMMVLCEDHGRLYVNIYQEDMMILPKTNTIPQLVNAIKHIIVTITKYYY